MRSRLLWVLSLLAGSFVYGSAVAQLLSKSYTLGSIAGPPDTYLESELGCSGIVCTISNSVTTTARDVVVQLNWYGPGGENALQGTWPCFGMNMNCGWSWDNKGASPVSQPSTRIVNGTADFTGSLGITQAPCLGYVCSPPNGADFYEFLDRDFGLGYGREGFQLTQTQGYFASVARQEDDPLQPGAAVETPVVEFQSRARPLGITVEYTFTLGNLSDQPVEFDIPHLNWSGILAAGVFSEWSIVAPHALASLVRSRAELQFADGSRITGPVELLSPVPAPLPVYLFAAGIATIGWRHGRRRRRG